MYSPLHRSQYSQHHRPQTFSTPTPGPGFPKSAPPAISFIKQLSQAQFHSQSQPQQQSPIPRTPVRTTKTSHKLVVLPSAPQTKPLRSQPSDEHEYDTDVGEFVREKKSAAERMSKDERKKAGFKRITAYCVAEGLIMKLLARP